MDKDTVYIVSGFMRTGTSMMMRALEAGGMDACYRASRDEMRKQYADEQYDPNEGGLYELESNDYKEFNFPEKFQGKLIKCLMGGLRDVSPMKKVKVVFMRRDFEEIRQSYQAFFDSEMTIKKENLDNSFNLIIRQLENRKDTELDVLNYRDVVENPLKYFSLLKEKGWPIDVQKASEIVDPSLCRFRKEILTEGII